MAQLQPNPQVHQMLNEMSLTLYPAHTGGINAWQNLQLAHKEVMSITKLLGQLNHEIKRVEHGSLDSTPCQKVLCKMAVLVVRRKFLLKKLGLGTTKDPIVFPPDFKTWIV